MPKKPPTTDAAIADALGCATPSNFIAMFKRSFGRTPARYFVQREALR